MKANCTIYALALTLTVINGTQAQSPSGSVVPVTADNFIRAESDVNFGVFVQRGGFGKFNHRRELIPIDGQTVIRPNRDTLYSTAVFDLDAGPVTISLPDAGNRFMSMQVIDEDHYTQAVIYGTGSHTFTRGRIGIRQAGRRYTTRCWCLARPFRIQGACSAPKIRSSRCGT